MSSCLVIRQTLDTGGDDSLEPMEADETELLRSNQRG